MGQARPLLHPGPRRLDRRLRDPGRRRLGAPGGLRQRGRLRTEPDRILEVEWDPGSASVFLVQIQVEALDRSRLLSDVTRVLSDNHVSILSAQVTTSRDRVAVSRFTFEMADATHLDHVLNAVRRVDGVFDVYRITGSRQA
nr:ACT domain-containing protein [Quadrisphaera sp. INWT6]